MCIWLCSYRLLHFLFLLAVGNASFLKSLFTMNMNVYRSIDYRMLSITAGVILVSGMVHTEYTIPGIQFASYGMLIAALVIKTACVNAQAEDHVLLWMSLIYLILFSMAIPVMYHSEIEKATLFHVISVVSLYFCSVYDLDVQSADRNAINLFYVIPVAIAVIGDTIIMVMRWKEKVNGFVLIFLIAASVMWIAGRIAAAVRLHG